jgi:hypothetical protein
MSYQSLIDDAIARARVKVASGLPQPTDKLASAHDGGALLGEAEKIANALEYMAMATADDGSAAGAARAEMVRDFFKTAAEADKKKGIAQPLVTETTTSGTQKVAPQAGKAKLAPQGLVSGDSPKQTTAPDGMMSRNAMEQTPSASPTKAASLYDMLMGARMAKIAAESGAAAPRQMDSTQPPPAHPKGQEGGHAQGPLSTSESIVAAKRRELHAPTRNRLSELFAHSGDTAQSLESAAGTFPLAAAKGGMKVASLAAAMQKEATDAAPGAFKTPISELGQKNMDSATGYVQRGAGHVGDFFKTKGGRNVALGALGVGGVAAGTLYARKKLEDMGQGGRERRMMEIQKESSVSIVELAALMQKEAADAPPGAFQTPISELGQQNIDSVTGYAQRGAGHVGDFLKTKGGRNVALGALGVGGVAAGTLYARKKLKDMKQGSRERRMRELSQGY